MKQKKLIFNFFVNRNWKKLTDSRKRAQILADNRKSHHPIETLFKGMSLWKYMDIQTTLNFPLRSALESSRRTLKLYLLQPASVLSWKTLDPPDNRLFLLQKVTEDRLQWCR